MPFVPAARDCTVHQFVGIDCISFIIRMVLTGLKPHLRSRGCFFNLSFMLLFASTVFE